ncbi:glycosyltransferase [Polynucleobacter sp. UB-Siik-W21]|uniref:glycosyltransferase n=1 Tax=Polynucleobacter sp. UB-Siik-W21 TaxID=1855646 RepID=UPI001BFE4E42|nr:glycosyltransferase [Polynucleobacter sp. UB-Siik-W21]QWD70721.1 glycosyltransferase [Polynucleobacter sp. UB-Siik-W21]
MLKIIQLENPKYREEFYSHCQSIIELPIQIYYSEARNKSIIFNANNSAFEYQRCIGNTIEFFGMYWQVNVGRIPIKRGDVIIVDGNPRILSNFYILAKSFFLGAKTVWWGHYWSSTSKHYRATFRFLIMLFYDYILFYTKNEKIKYSNIFFKKNNKNVYYLNNGMNYSAINSKACKYNPVNRKYDILFLGRCTEKSDLDLLLQSLKINKMYRFKLAVLGYSDDAEEKLILNKINKMNLGSCVDLYPLSINEDDISKVANQCKIFCYPGSVGLSLIHSYCYGLPSVIHSNREFQMPESDAFINGITGLYFEYGNVDSLAKILSNILLEDNDRLNIMSNNCLSIVKNDYNFKNMGIRLKELYENIITIK